MSDVIQPSAIPAKPAVKTAARLFEAAARLRVSEKLVLIYLTYVSMAAPFYRVWVTQGLTIAVLNFLASGVITLLSKYSADSGSVKPAGSPTAGSLPAGSPPWRPGRQGTRPRPDSGSWAARRRL